MAKRSERWRRYRRNTNIPIRYDYSAHKNNFWIQISRAFILSCVTIESEKVFLPRSAFSFHRNMSFALRFTISTKEQQTEGRTRREESDLWLRKDSKGARGAPRKEKDETMRRGFLNHKVRAGMGDSAAGCGRTMGNSVHSTTSKNIKNISFMYLEGTKRYLLLLLFKQPAGFATASPTRLHLLTQAEKLPSNIKRHRNSIAFNSNNPQIGFLLGKVCEWCRVGNWPQHVLPTHFIPPIAQGYDFNRTLRMTSLRNSFRQFFRSRSHTI